MQTKTITLGDGKSNKRFPISKSYDQLKQKTLERFQDIKEPFKFQYECDNDKFDIENEADLGDFFEGTCTKLTVIQIKNLVKEPCIEVLFNDKLIEFPKIQEFSKLLDEFSNKLQLPSKVGIQVSYEIDGDKIDIEAQDEYTLFLEEGLNIPLLFIYQPKTKTEQIQDTLDEQSLLQGRFEEQKIGQNQALQENNIFDKKHKELFDMKQETNDICYAQPQQESDYIAQQSPKDNKIEEETTSNNIPSKISKPKELQFEELSEQDQKLFNYFQKQTLERIKKEYMNYVSKNLKSELVQYMRQQFPIICNDNNTSDQDPTGQLKMAFNALLDSDQIVSRVLQRKKISVKNFQQFSETLTPEIKESFYNFCSIEIDKRLASGQDFKTLFTHDLFVQNHDHPLHSFDDYKLIVFMATRLVEKSTRVFSLYSRIPGKPLPFAFKSIDDKQTIIIPLSSYQEIFENGYPNLISLGPAKCGKSKLLNQLFPPIFQFAEDLDRSMYPLHYGVNVICSTDQFELGFHTFDFNMNFSSHDSQFSEEVDEIMEILEIFPKQGSKILLHSVSEDDFSSNIKTLIQRGWKSDQIFFLLRDCNEILMAFDMAMEEFHFEKDPQLKFIRKIEKTNVFESELNKLRVSLLAWSKNNYNMQLSYYDFETCAKKAISKKKSFQINLVDEQDKIFEDKVSKILAKVQPTKENNYNLHNEIFKAILLRDQIMQCDIKSGNAHKEEDQKKKIKIIKECTERKQQLDQQLKSLVPHQSIYLFDEIIRQKSLKNMGIFERQLGCWQDPILAPKYKERKIKSEKKQIYDQQLIKHAVATNEIQNDQSKTETFKNDVLSAEEIKEIESEIDVLKGQIRKISNDIDKIRISKEHFFRELDYIYEILQQLNLEIGNTFNKEEYLDSFVQFVKNGCEFEFIDGENNRFHEDTVSEILKRVEDGDETSPFVISIIGPQSTGKSTLLNFLFNTSFLVSAGRCTKGMYASLFDTDYEKARRVLILDSEGLLSIEKNDPAYDKKLTTLGMALSQVLLINVMGDFNQAMKEILAMSLLAGNQLKVFLGKRPILIFVLRNCIDDDISKMREIVDKIEDELKKVAETVKVNLHDIVDYRGDQNFCLMYSAYNKDDQTNEGKKLYSFCVVNDSFRHKSTWLLQKIFNEAEDPKLDRHQNLKEVVKKAKNIWTALGSYNQLLSLKSISEMNDRQELQGKVNEIRQQLIERDRQEEEQKINQDQKNLSQRIEEELEYQELDIEKLSDKLNNISSEFTQRVKTAYEERTSGSKIDKALIQEYLEMLTISVRLIINRANDELERRKAFSGIMNQVDLKKKQLNEYMTSQLQNNASRLEKADENEKKNLCTQLEKNFGEQMKQLQNSLHDGINDKMKNDYDLCMDAYKFMQQVISQEGLTGKTFLSQNHLEKANREINQGQIYPIEWVIIKPEDPSEKYDPTENFDEILPYLIEVTGYDSTTYYNQVYSQQSNGRNDIQENIQNVQPRIGEGDQNTWDKIMNFIFQKKVIGNSSSHEEQKQTAKPPKQNAYSQEIPQQKRNKHQQNKNSGYIEQANSHQEYMSIQHQIEQRVANILQKRGLLSFLEIREGLHGSLTKIQNSSGINISMMQTILKNIEELLQKSEEYYFKDHKIHFKKGYIEQLVTKVLFYGLLQYYKKTQAEQIKIQKQKFKEEMDKMNELFKAKLKSFLGDQESADLIAKLMYDTLIENCKNLSAKKYIEFLKANTTIQPAELMDIGDKILDSEYKYQKKDFVDWATNVSVYLDRIFDKEFKNRQDEQQKKNFLERKNEINENFKKLKSIIENTLTAFKNLQLSTIVDKIKEKDHEVVQKLIHQLLIKFLCQPSQIKDIVILINGYVEIENDKISVQDAEDFSKIYAKCFEQKDIFGQNANIVSDGKIRNPSIFVQQVSKKLENLTGNLNKWIEQTLKIPCVAQADINSIMSDKKEFALGCRQVCPYCGAKCTEDGGNGHSKHKTNRHRIMGLRGSHKMVGGQIALLEMCCTSTQAQKSVWKDSNVKEAAASTSNQSIDASVRQMIEEQKCTMGKLNFTLAWSDPNDLDMFITCPCGSQIGLGGKCSTCGGTSDCDMNHVGPCHATAPMEHVFYNDQAQQGTYTVFVRMFRAQKTYNGITGGPSSSFTVKAHSGTENYQQWSHTLSQGQNVSWSFVYSKSLKFYDHCQKYYDNWIITEGSNLNSDLESKCILAMEFNKAAIKEATKLN